MQRSSRIPLTIALLTSVAVVACDDEGTGPGEYHADDVATVQLVLGGGIIASYDVASRTWSNALSIDEGFRTDYIVVDFRDEFGDPADLGFEFYLEVTIDNDFALEFDQDVFGEFGGYFFGANPGFAGVTFSLIHDPVGESEHADLVSRELDVEVLVP